MRVAFEGCFCCVVSMLVWVRLAGRLCESGQEGRRRRVAGVERRASLVAAGGEVLKLLCIVRRWGGGRVLTLTAAVVPCREALVELAFADKANAVAVGVVHVME